MGASAFIRTVDVVDWVMGTLLFAAIAATILWSFVVVPELMERRGFNPRSGFVRGLVWISFLLIVFLPAVVTGYVFSVRNPADWVIFGLAMTVAILYDFYRLNPEKIPWARART
jgi:hypothetical protein